MQDGPLPFTVDRLLLAPDAGRSAGSDVSSFSAAHFRTPPPVGPGGRRPGRPGVLCLIYDEEKRLGARSKSEADAFTGEYFAFTEAIQKSGHYLGGEALQSVQTARTIRVRNGKVSTTDGPFAETKEQLGGFYLIDARDLNDASQVASKIPSARLGCVEVRPIREFNRP